MKTARTKTDDYLLSLSFNAECYDDLTHYHRVKCWCWQQQRQSGHLLSCPSREKSVSECPVLRVYTVLTLSACAPLTLDNHKYRVLISTWYHCHHPSFNITLWTTLKLQRAVKCQSRVMTMGGGTVTMVGGTVSAPPSVGQVTSLHHCSTERCPTYWVVVTHLLRTRDTSGLILVQCRPVSSDLSPAPDQSRVQCQHQVHND